MRLDDIRSLSAFYGRLTPEIEDAINKAKQLAEEVSLQHRGIRQIAQELRTQGRLLDRNIFPVFYTLQEHLKTFSEQEVLRWEVSRNTTFDE